MRKENKKYKKEIKKEKDNFCIHFLKLNDNV